MKFCPHCKLRKPLTEFYRLWGNERGVRQWRSWCKKCMIRAAIQRKRNRVWDSMGGSG